MTSLVLGLRLTRRVRAHRSRCSKNSRRYLTPSSYTGRIRPCLKVLKKGKTVFKGAQTAAVEARVSRFQEHVAPKMKTFCDYSYIPNKTTFQKLCMDVFNEDLPVNMKKITHRAIANNAKYWNIVGVITTRTMTLITLNH